MNNPVEVMLGILEGGRWQMRRCDRNIVLATSITREQFERADAMMKSPRIAALLCTTCGFPVDSHRPKTKNCPGEGGGWEVRYKFKPPTDNNGLKP